MKTGKFGAQKIIHFRQWSRKSYAVFNSLRSIIKISRLNVAFSILTLSVSQLAAQVEQQALTGQNVELDELEVSAQAEPLVFTEVGRVITTITQKEIEQAPINDLAELLSFVQSVDIRQRGGQGIQADVSIRGGSFDQVLVLLNGIPISDPQTGHFNLNIPVNLSDIQKVEILKGPGARTFGPNAYSGAINIITKTNSEKILSLRLKGGQYAFYDYGASANLQYKKWHTLLTYHQKASDGYMENTDFIGYQAFIHSQLQLKKMKLEAQLGFLKKNFGANSFYSPKYTMQYEKNESRIASLGFHFGGKIKISILPYYRQHRDNWQLTRTKPDLYQNFHQTDVLGARIKMIFHTVLGKTILGFNIKNEKLLSSNMGEKMDWPQRIPWASSHEFQYHFQRKDAGIYWEQSKSFLKKWNAVFGLLTHWYSEESSNIGIYPGLDISYYMNSNIKLFTSVNQAMRLPTFTDMFYSGPSNIGNPDLKPETSLSLELGISFVKKNYKIEGAIFRRYGNNTIDWVWQDSIWKTENITKLITDGLEISTQINPATLWNIKIWKTLGLDYTYLNLIKKKSDIKSKYALNNLRHQLNINLQFEIFRNVFLQIQSSYKDRIGTYQTYYFEEKKYVDKAYTDWWLINTKLTWRQAHFQIFLEAQNIGNAEMVEFGVQQPGLWIVGGVQYHIFK